MSEENVNRVCYCDMDGVLADFDAGYRTISGGLDSKKVPKAKLWSDIHRYGKDKFFSELPWMPGGEDLWQFINTNFLHVKILSALGRTDKNDKLTTKGKTMWLNHHLPGLQSKNIILVENKHKKQEYSKPGDIIIDDTESVITEWNEVGGIGILHVTAPKTISVLESYV